MEMKAASRSPTDLFGVLAVSALYTMVVLADRGGLVRSLLGLPFVLICPGYALLSAILGDSAQLDVSERLTLSGVLSLAIVISVATGLNVIRRLDLAWLVCVLEAITVAGCARAYWRRTQMPSARVGHPGRLRLRQESHSALATMIDFVALSCVCAIFFLTAGLIQFEQASVPTTALYLLGDESRTGGYVKSVACGSRFRVTVGVINNEQTVKNYSIRMRMDDQPSQILTRITLAPGEIWEEPIEVSPDRCGALQSVAFDLLEAKSESPERSVYQRVRVTASDEREDIRE